MVENKDNNLCFTVNLAHLTHPHFTDNQALERGKELQRLAGLSDQTEVTLSDIGKFEQILNSKIVVYYRLFHSLKHSFPIHLTRIFSCFKTTTTV